MPICLCANNEEYWTIKILNTITILQETSGIDLATFINKGCAQFSQYFYDSFQHMTQFHTSQNIVEKVCISDTGN